MEHLPTVEASIRYWEAIRVLAIRARDDQLERIATGLSLSYGAARLELTKRQRPPLPPPRRPHQK
jgi:hypothetical protein